MPEYISREETVKAFCEKCQGYYDGHCIHRGECDIDVIKTAPSADVQPVRHGRWIAENRDNRGYADCYTCTNCNCYTYTYTLMKDCEHDYCPNCGARMIKDGDANG